MDVKFHVGDMASNTNEYAIDERKLAVSFSRPREERGGFQPLNKR